MEITSYLLGKKAGGGSGGSRDWSQIGYSAEPQGIQDGFDYAIEVMNNWDSSQTSLSYKFTYNINLVYMPLVDTSNATNFSSMFVSCLNLNTIPQLNTSNGTNFSSMFSYCYNLQKVPQLNTSTGTNFSNMFYYCSTLKEIGLLDLGNATNINALLGNDESIQILGGFKDLGKNYSTSQSENYSNYTLNLSSCSKLTHDSLMNVINNLYDIKTKGCNNQKLVLGNTNLAKLSAEEIAIATNKGWNVTQY